MTTRGLYYKKARDMYNEIPIPIPKQEKTVSFSGEDNVYYKHKQEQPHSKPVEMRYETVNHPNTGDPAVWGSAFWFTLHNGSIRYPINASKLVADRMKGFIRGIVYILPCPDCAAHATSFIENPNNNFDTICSGRENLFDFFCQFHNYVNKRYGKPEMSTADAYKLYSNGANVTKLTYK
jgi:hypothetical protein